MVIKSNGKGKSGGARIINYVVVSKTEIYLLTIYDKNEKESVADKEILDLINNIVDIDN